MEGFTNAMNPSIGLFRCCDIINSKSFRDSNRVDLDVVKLNRANYRGVQRKSALFGVGIGFLPDKSGALVVKTLTPEGVYENIHLI